jgi:flagellar hook-length control protein FliK
MNHAQIDYLLQLPVPRPESAPSTSRARDDAPAFDNHFRQASELGTGSPSSSSPLSSTAPRPAEPERDDNQPHPPAFDQRSNKPAAESSSQPPTESASPTVSASAAENSAATNEEDDTDDAQTEAATEAAAVLTAVEPTTKATDSEAAAAAKSSPNSESPDRARDTSAAHARRGQVNTDSQPTPTAADEASDTLTAAESANPVDAEQPVGSATERSVAGEASRNASVDASSTGGAELGAALVAEDNGAPHAKETSLNDDGDVNGGLHNIVATDAAGENPAGIHAASAFQNVEPLTASTTAKLQSAADDAPKKSDKKSTTRTDALHETAASPNERPAAVARAADAPAVAPIAANVQAQLPPGGATPSASTDSPAKSKDTAIAAKEGLLSPFARLERGGAGGTLGSRRAGRGEGAPQVDPARFVSRVARAIHTAQERGGPLQLRLSPPELGAMRLELSVNQGALSATIETENSTARQLLLDNLPALRDRLAEQNIKIERFDVDVRQDSSGSGQPKPGPQEQGLHQRHDPTSNRGAAARRTAGPIAIDETSPIRRTITNTSINVVA